LGGSSQARHLPRVQGARSGRVGDVGRLLLSGRARPGGARAEPRDTGLRSRAGGRRQGAQVSDPFAAGSPPVVGAVDGDRLDCDIAILGSGMGGATLAWALRGSGARVLVVERGDFMRREDENWSPSAVF